MNFDGASLEDPIALLQQPGSIAPAQVSKNQIKRPHNAYNLYFIERLPIEKEANPSLSGNEISHLIGKKWSEMDDESKRPYRERAQEIKAKFREEYPDYHYQKGAAKFKKKKDMILQPRNVEHMDTQQRVEMQVRNLFSFLGAQAVSQYLLKNKASVDEIGGIARNFTRMVGNPGMEEPMDVQ